MSQTEVLIVEDDRAGRLQFFRFASPRTLYKMVKNRLLRKPQERFRHLDSGTYLLTVTII